jgi:hypothetical protein
MENRSWRISNVAVLLWISLLLQFVSSFVLTVSQQMFRALLHRAKLRPEAGGGGAGGSHEAILQGSGTLGRDSHIHRYSRFCVLLSDQRELNG